MDLASPDTKSSPSLLADWLELYALFSPRRSVRRAELDSIFRLTVEERPLRMHRDETTGERDDGEILEFELEELVVCVSQEFEWRTEKLADAYPFRLQKVGGGAAPVWELSVHGDPTKIENITYITCLLIVAYRRGLLVPQPNSEAFTNHHIGRLFQICACLALGGYLNGEVVSFGWPRAEGDSFLPALQKAWGRFGSYQVVDAIPDGAPDNLKDGGLDVIAWRHFRDGRPACILIFGQAASGDDWIRKSALEPAETLVGSWFVSFRPKAWLPATIMPFIVHEDLDPESSKDVERSIKGRMQYHEQSHGLILDRIRVASAAHFALTSKEIDRSRIDGTDRVEELVKWVGSILPTQNSNTQVDVT
jgi:hypothetical protein